MKPSRLFVLFFAIAIAFQAPLVLGEDVFFGQAEANGKQVFWLKNDSIQCSVAFKGGELESDTLRALPEWLSKLGRPPIAITTDADFRLDMMWARWRAPRKVNNAENPVSFSKKDFQLQQHDVRELPGGAKELDLYFKGLNTPLELRITYQVEPQTFYVRHKVAVRDTSYGHHFLCWIWPLRGFLLEKVKKPLKSGGFG